MFMTRHGSCLPRRDDHGPRAKCERRAREEKENRRKKPLNLGLFQPYKASLDDAGRDIN